MTRMTCIERTIDMGHVFVDIELSNPREPELVPIKVTALAELTGYPVQGERI